MSLARRVGVAVWRRRARPVCEAVAERHDHGILRERGKARAPVAASSEDDKHEQCGEEAAGQAGVHKGEGTSSMIVTPY
jgi:hypothetical protein